MLSFLLFFIAFFYYQAFFYQAFFYYQSCVLMRVLEKSVKFTLLIKIPQFGLLVVFFVIEMRRKRVFCSIASFTNIQGYAMNTAQ